MTTTFAALRRLVWKDLKQHRAEFTLFVIIAVMLGVTLSLDTPAVFWNLLPSMGPYFKVLSPRIRFFREFVGMAMNIIIPLVLVWSLYRERVSGTLYQMAGFPVSRVYGFAAKCLTIMIMLFVTTMISIGIQRLLFYSLADVPWSPPYGYWTANAIPRIVLDVGVVAVAVGVAALFKRRPMTAGIITYILAKAFVFKTSYKVGRFLVRLYYDSQHYARNNWDIYLNMSLSRSQVLKVL